MSTPNPIERIGLRVAQVLGLAPPDPPMLPAVQAQPRPYPSTPATAQRVLDRRGVLPQQAAEDTARSRRLYDAITPIQYGLYNTSMPENSSEEADVNEQFRPARAIRALLGGEPGERRPRASAAREDAWRTYLGLPQQNNSLSVSRFRPSNSRDRDAVYYSLGTEPVIDRLREIRSVDPFLAAFGVDRVNPNVLESRPELIRKVVEGIDQNNGRLAGGDRGAIGNRGVMGEYSLTRGRDAIGPYVAYYDRWDLDGTWTEGESGRYGKPFEIYDRIYYNPRTFEPFTEDQLLIRQRALKNQREVRESFRALTPPRR